MTSKSNITSVVSSLGIQPPKRRSSFLNSGDAWLEDKQEIEGAEGLWRVHNDIYDLTDFVEKHPGGSQWLQLTKGTDITEAFEVHHLRKKPTELLKKFHIRKATSKRNYPFTFKEDGFYKTLKKEVVKELENNPSRGIDHSAFISDCLLAATFIVSILAVRFWNFWLALPAGYLLTVTVIAGHNFLHKKDNFRMYYFTFSLLQLREWRIIHALSHHLHTNTVVDLEITKVEPLLQYLPTKKPLYLRLLSPLYSPFYWVMIFHLELSKRYILLVKGHTIHLGWPEIVPFLLPTCMYIFGGQNFISVFCMWNCIVFAGSFYFGFVALTGAHHHPDIFHDGDTPRSNKEIDWGVSQLDAVMDKKEINGSPYLVLTSFGDHALHHLFPTLDHGVLEHLYPILNKVMKQFNIDLRITSSLKLIKGQFQQLAKNTPNPNAPNLLKKYY